MSHSDCLSLPWSPSDAQASVVLVRHGRTSYNRERKFLGRTDIALDERGKAEVARLAGLGELCAQVRSSPLTRARQTACAISEVVLEDPAWRELDQGQLEGMLPQDAVAAFPEFFRRFQEDPGGTPVPGGESLGTRIEQARRALDQLGEQGGVHVVVTHQMVIAGLRCTIAEPSLARWRRYCVPNASVSILERRGAAWVECLGGWVPVGPDTHDV